MSSFQNTKAIDIFCGCGGMSWGLHKSGIEVLLGIDSDEKYIQSFRKNFGKEKTSCMDIREVRGKDILSNLGIMRGELDLLVGGPPCQGFSKNTPVSRRNADSDNNLLINEYLRIADELLPQNLIIENVAEMKRGFDGSYTDRIYNELSDRGYNIVDHVFDASDYGLPQRRKRAFFLGSRVGRKIAIPPKTHFDESTNTDDLFGFQHKVTVWDAIGDLPNVSHDEKLGSQHYRCDPFSDYQRSMRGSLQTVSNHTPRKMSDIQFRRLSALQPGQGLKDLPEDLQVKGGYSGVYGRLTKSMVAPTITRWVFHPGSGRWGHPEDIRTITPRETARIQGFSDDYEFEGTYTDICGQLGNAVPPLLMKTILQAFSD